MLLTVAKFRDCDWVGCCCCCGRRVWCSCCCAVLLPDVTDDSDLADEGTDRIRAAVAFVVGAHLADTRGRTWADGAAALGNIVDIVRGEREQEGVNEKPACNEEGSCPMRCSVCV